MEFSLWRSALELELLRRFIQFSRKEPGSESLLVILAVGVSLIRSDISIRSLQPNIVSYPYIVAAAAKLIFRISTRKQFPIIFRSLTN